MAKNKKATNPFYTLLVLVGAAFVVAACAYGVMAYRGVSAMEPDSHPLTVFLDTHGATLMIGMAALIALLTLAAIATDSIWQRRNKLAADLDQRETPTPHESSTTGTES